MGEIAPPVSSEARYGNWTIAGILGLLIITALASIPLTLTILHYREADALVIDLAGRQRMLLERHMKELLLAAQGVPVQYQDTRALLQERLHALINGGAIPARIGRSELALLPGAPTQEIRDKLLEQQRLLDVFANQAETLLQAPSGSSAYKSLRDQLLKDNAVLLTTANDAVGLLTRYSESRIQHLIRWEIIAVVLVVTVAALGTWIFLKTEHELKKSQAVTMEALRQSDAVKSSLLSSVSHELRTPLTSIKSMLFSLKSDSSGTPPRTEFLQSIDEQVDYLNRLVGNLLDMSRLEAGMLKPRCEWQVFEELVEGAIRRVAPLLKDRPLDVQLAPDLPPISVDGVQIQQVLVNLLDNAIKFSPAGSQIRLAASMKGTDLEVRVSNAGEGVPADQLDRIFDRFYRPQSGDSSRPPGTGLGLAICKSIIEAHGGQILARSVPGGETTFIFRLPFTISKEHAVSLNSPSAQRAS